MAISKDRYAQIIIMLPRIIIMRTETTLHSEAGCTFADSSRRNRFFLQFGGRPYTLRH